jgi:hypothetical protein
VVRRLGRRAAQIAQADAPPRLEAPAGRRQFADRLAIEAGRRAWDAELGPDETPFEAGLPMRSASRA